MENPLETDPGIPLVIDQPESTSIRDRLPESSKMANNKRGCPELSWLKTSSSCPVPLRINSLDAEKRIPNKYND